MLGALASETGPLLDQGIIQFILFGVMMIVIFVVLWITIAK
jgi:hypothetical protein